MRGVKFLFRILIVAVISSTWVFALFNILKFIFSDLVVKAVMEYNFSISIIVALSVGAVISLFTLTLFLVAFSFWVGDKVVGE